MRADSTDEARLGRSTRHLWLRSDGGSEIGIGHLVRSIACATSAVRRGLTAILVTDPNGIGEHVGTRAGLEVRPAPAAESWMEWLGPDDIVLFDGYHLAPEVHAVAQGAPSSVRIAVLDDFGFGHFPVDVVVCPNPPGEVTYAVKPGGIVLSGPRHAPVRARFRELRRRRPTGTNRLLLSFGGADPRQLLSTAIASLAPTSVPFAHTVAVVGPSAPVVQATTIELVRDPPDMAAVMDHADAAVVAAGSTVWEACTIGLPIAAVRVAENQVGIERALREANAALLLEPGPGFGDDLVHAVTALSDPSVQGRLADAAMTLVDGLGAERILDALLGS